MLLMKFFFYLKQAPPVDPIGLITGWCLPQNTLPDRVPEGLSEVLGHEAVHDGVEAAVEVGQQPERLSHGFEGAQVQLLQQPKGHENIVDDDRTPTQREQSHHCHQHLHDLRRRITDVTAISCLKCDY